MARNLEDIFNECYERIRSGESLQSCLARYPEHRAELKSLLETALDVGRRASYIHPRPEFKHWAQVRIQGAQHYSRQQRQPETPSHFSWWRQSWAVAVTAVLILLLTTGSTMAASSNAMPDQTLYPVKLATEEMRLALAVTDTQKAQIHTQLAETRAVEVETMANEGKTEHAAITAARLAKQLEQANSAIAKVESTSAIPPEETITPPEETVTPPEETVTPPEETVTPPEETVTPPEETITPPQETVTPPEETITPPEETITPPEETITPPEETVTPPQETVTPPEETTTVTPPQETVTPPEETTTVTPPQETVTPPDTTKGKTTSAKKTERFKKSLETSTSKSLTALENAKEKASQQSKADWQRAINTITEKSKDKHDNQGWSDNKTWGGWQPNTVSPNQSQPYPWK